MRLLLTAKKLTGSPTFFDVSYKKMFYKIETLREAWCVNMFFHKWSMLMRNMLKAGANLWGDAGKESDRLNKVIKENEERLKEQENKRNRKYLHFIL